MKEMFLVIYALGIGSQCSKLLNSMDIETIDQLATVPKEKLVEKFGLRQGNFLADISTGIDTTEVAVSNDVPKSISEEESFRKLTELGEVKRQMMILIRKLLKRLEKDSRPPRTIKLSVRKHDMKNNYARVSRQTHFEPKILKVENKERVVNTILDIVIALFDKIVDKKQGFDLAVINICFTNFDEMNKAKISQLFCKDFDGNNTNKGKTKSDKSPSKFLTQSKAFINYKPDRHMIELERQYCENNVNHNLSQAQVTQENTETCQVVNKKNDVYHMISNDHPSSMPDTSMNAKDTPLTTSNTLDSESCSDSMIHYTPDHSSCDDQGSTSCEQSMLGDSSTRLTNTLPEKSLNTSGTECIQGTSAHSDNRGTLCPAGMDYGVFRELPEDIQKELMENWKRKDYQVVSVKAKAAPPKKRQKKNDTAAASRNIRSYFSK